MKAVVHDRYGPPEVLRVEEVERPVPKEDEVLVRVHATTVTRADCGFRSAHPFLSRFFTGLRGPTQRILGSELAGEVEAIGAGVTEFSVGDRVFGTTGGFRANAEYVCVRESAPIAKMPEGLTFVEAAAVSDGAILALNALALAADISAGQSLLVYGASGSIGTAGVQLGKHLGAHVTAVCNTRNLALVRSLGAERVLDYTKEDFTKTGDAYDVVFDAVGKTKFGRSKRALKKGGVFLPTDGWGNLLLALAVRRVGDKRIRVTIPPRYRKEDVLLVKRLLENGEYRAVVDRTYPLEDVVEATKYVETEQKTGNVVLTVA